MITNEMKIDLLNEALAPIVEAVRVNDGDTLSRLRPDSEVLWTATGSWDKPAEVTLGDLRRLARLMVRG